MNRKYFALAASLILGATGFSFAQQTSSNAHSMHDANSMMAMCTNCPGMQGDITKGGASQAAKSVGTESRKTSTDYSKNPYSGRMDWNYISANHP